MRTLSAGRGGAGDGTGVDGDAGSALMRRKKKGRRKVPVCYWAFGFGSELRV